MYVDESGTTNHNDASKQYILSGVISHIDEVKDLKKMVNQYKYDNFFGEYIDAEVHTHNIFKSKAEFAEITLKTKYQLLDNLFETVSDMNITTISVIINKGLLKSKYPTWSVSKTAWTYLVERYDKYIEYSGNADQGGIIKLDKSSSKQQAEAFKIINELRKNEVYHQEVKHIIQDPIFVNSAGVEGIQVADVIAYCTFRYKTGSTKFEPYWNKIYDKFRKGKSGTVIDYGIKEFPKEM